MFLTTGLIRHVEGLIRHVEGLILHVDDYTPIVAIHLSGLDPPLSFVLRPLVVIGPDGEMMERIAGLADSSSQPQSMDSVGNQVERTRR